MDYGKLAYLKVEELEARLATATQTGKSMVTSATVNPLYDFTRGDFRLCELYASGHVSVTVKVNLRADETKSEAKLSLKVNGLTAGVSSFSATSGKATEQILICGAFVDGSATLTLSSNFVSTLISAQVVVSGSLAQLRRYGGSVAIDKSGDNWLAVKSEDDNIYAVLFNESKVRFSVPIYIGTGRKADVCKSVNGGFAIVYIDEADNVVLVTTDESVETMTQKFLVSGGTDVAITPYGSGVIVALLKDGKVELYSVRGGAICNIVSTNTGVSETVSGISFVKNSSAPMLIFETQSASYLKEAEKETVEGENILLTVAVAVTAKE